MKEIRLQISPSPEDTEWKFTFPLDMKPPKPREGVVFGKVITFTAEAITFRFAALPNNRIIQDDDPSKFVLLTFGSLRFPNTSLRVTGEYIARILEKGLFLNGIQYRFYHHSNSQLRSRSCFLRQANSDAELDERIYALGDFRRINNIAKRAKRIGLLFSQADLDFVLDPTYTQDIPDIQVDDEIFSDGCGLITKRLAVQISRSKRIIVRGIRYTPCVYQIRYRGYKGVVMLHPELDKLKGPLVQFRKSMKKFTATGNNTFSVVGYSVPYAFGRLNNEIIILLSSLGIPNETFIRKQEVYFSWIEEATTDPIKAFEFLCANDKYPIAERLLLDSLDSPEVSKALKGLQNSEISSFRKEGTNRGRSRTIVEKSRLLFGVCDPFGVLKEGQVHIRITMGRSGPATPIHGDVLVVRNPCLHPGDCLKLRAAHHPKLTHLVDCIVFASTAKPGHHAAPSMSSGGDLDGDKFFVCWDPDLVPSRILQSYDYPPNKEKTTKNVTRKQLAEHFAYYNNASLARIAGLHGKWARASPKGAMSSECQELNALHSQSVDGAGVKIPERLTNPPETSPGTYIIELLENAAKSFADRLTTSRLTTQIEVAAEDAEEMLLQLLQCKQRAISEFELFQAAHRFCRKHSKLDLRSFLGYFNWGALTAQEKYTICFQLGVTKEQYREHPYIWNSLLRSDILSRQDIYQRSLDQPFALQRLYGSRHNGGLATFFTYLRLAVQDFVRKLIIIKVDSRFAVAIFLRGVIPWDEECSIVQDQALEEDETQVARGAVVCCFLPQTTSNFSNYRPCTPGYRIHCGYNLFQLFNKQKQDSWIFLTKPPSNSGADLAASIALQKISQRVQKQVGRCYRNPITEVEIHVVSNRDRISQQLFDLWFEHVPTEERVGRFDRDATSYRLNRVQDVDWSTIAEDSRAWLMTLFSSRLSEDNLMSLLSDLEIEQLDIAMDFALKFRAEEEAYTICKTLASKIPFPISSLRRWLQKHPPFAFLMLHQFQPDESTNLLHPILADLADAILHSVIKCANNLTLASLVAIEKISGTVAVMPIVSYLELLWEASLSIRSRQVVQEILLVLDDSRRKHNPELGTSDMYALKMGLGIMFDRAEEAADSCPCDDSGRPVRQRTPPQHTTLRLTNKEYQVKAFLRVDSPNSIRLHSHIRLQAASKVEGHWLGPPIMDGLVVQSTKGEMTITLKHPPPPEMERMDWNMYDAGSIATSRAMLDALQRLLEEKSEACAFYSLITGDGTELLRAGDLGMAETDTSSATHLNSSQLEAVDSCTGLVSLIWGPPGTGKTTVIVEILSRLLRSGRLAKILMTASTHNAVDNVLERFLVVNREKKILDDQQILRVSTDSSKVNSDLREYTIDARVGGDINENSRLAKQARQRLESARLVFTTCAGAGLGILRKEDFQVALIDEASQITEPCALIPLVKGIERCILVGDHVQLRPTVKRMGSALEFDMSLLERLYTGQELPQVSKSMLQVQYRFPEELARFPSHEFYEGKLKSATDSSSVLEPLSTSSFPWPRDAVSRTIQPTVLVNCSAEEDMTGRSKSNVGQVALIKQIVKLLTTQSEQATDTPQFKITVLTPYTKQIQELRRALPNTVPSSTVDSFQGRESDIIIFSAVRSNAEQDIGFLDDARRLNVMWTRARLGLIIVADKVTMSSNPLWKRALDSCKEVEIETPS